MNSAFVRARCTTGTRRVVSCPDASSESASRHSSQLRANCLVRVASLVLLLAPVTLADTVILRTGRELEGASRWRGDGKLEVTTRFGGVVVDRTDVARVIPSETPSDEVARRRAALAADDLAGKLELARFALDRQLERDAAALLVEVAAGAGHGAAEELLAGEAAHLLGARLDHHLVDGAWLAPADYYPSRGFVRRGNRWVPRDQARLAAEGARLEARSEQTRVEARRAERAVEPAQRAVSEAEVRLHRIQRALVTLAEDLVAARSEVGTREEAAAVADVRVINAQAALTYFLAGPFNASPEQELSVRANVAGAEQVRKRARDALIVARARLAELEQLQVRGPFVKAEAETALATAREGLAAAERARIATRTSAEQIAAERETNADRLREVRGLKPED